MITQHYSDDNKQFFIPINKALDLLLNNALHFHIICGLVGIDDVAYTNSSQTW